MCRPIDETVLVAEWADKNEKEAKIYHEIGILCSKEAWALSFFILGILYHDNF